MANIITMTRTKMNCLRTASLLICLLLASQAPAQKLTWGNEFNAPLRSEMVDFFPLEEGRSLGVLTPNIGSKARPNVGEVEIHEFDKDLQSIKQTQLSKLSWAKGYNYEFALRIEDQIHLFVSTKISGSEARALEVIKIDSKTLSYEAAPKRLFSAEIGPIANESHRDYMRNFFYTVSSDKANI